MTIEARHKAFGNVKSALASSPVLRLHDFKFPFELHIHWAKTGLDVVLSQRDGHKQEYVVAYASRSNNKAKSNYLCYKGEALGVVWAVTHYRHNLYGAPFTLITDHQPLEWLLASNKLKASTHADHLSCRNTISKSPTYQV